MSAQFRKNMERAIDRLLVVHGCTEAVTDADRRGVKQEERGEAVTHEMLHYANPKAPAESQSEDDRLRRRWGFQDLCLDRARPVATFGWMACLAPGAAALLGYCVYESVFPL